MKNLVKYSSYNQIIREFDVYIMLVNHEYQMKLVRKLDGDKPPKNRTNHRKSKFDILIEKIDKINQRMDNLIKKNNLME